MIEEDSRDWQVDDVRRYLEATVPTLPEAFDAELLGTLVVDDRYLRAIIRSTSPTELHLIENDLNEITRGDAVASTYGGICSEVLHRVVNYEDLQLQGRDVSGINLWR